mgnify:CR=1 FL=1
MVMRGEKLQFERFAIKLCSSPRVTCIHSSPVPFLYLISTFTTPLNLVPFPKSCTFPLVPFWPLYGTFRKNCVPFSDHFSELKMRHNKKVQKCTFCVPFLYELALFRTFKGNIMYAFDCVPFRRPFRYL